MAGRRHTEIVRLLVAAGANVNIPDRDGITALVHARQRGYHAMVDILRGGRSEIRSDSATDVRAGSSSVERFQWVGCDGRDDNVARRGTQIRPRRE